MTGRRGSLADEYDAAIAAARRFPGPLSGWLVRRLERAQEKNRRKIPDRLERDGLVSPLTAETLRTVDELDGGPRTRLMTETIYPTGDPDVFYDLARAQLAVQLEALDAVDGKVGLLFSTSSALLGILAAVFALRSKDLGALEYAAVGAFLVIYLVISWQSERAYRARGWNTGPSLKQVYSAYAALGGGDDRELKWKVANHVRIDYEKNQKFANLKLEALQMILPCVIGQTLILVLALVAVAAGW